MNLLLKRLRWCEQDFERCADIRIFNDKIVELGEDLSAHSREMVVILDGYFVYPGLINSHDHLEFNLYPQLGHPPYVNYGEWSKDIYQPNCSPIKEIQKVPLNDLLMWSAIKNLISGVTTVVHHNPYYKRFGGSFWPQKPFPIRVLKHYQWRHSLKLDQQRDRPRNFETSTPFMIHAAEGVDEESHQEIAELHLRGWLRENTVIIHGISIKDDQIQILADAKISLVWCPVSNFFLYGKTAPIPLLKGKVKIALGTDSTLTGSANLFDEMKSAFATGWITEPELFSMVTHQPASIFNIGGNSDALTAGSPADLLILPIQHSSYHRNLIQASPQDVQVLLCDGQPRLIDDAFTQSFGFGKPNVVVHRRPKWICVDTKGIRKRVTKVVPSSILNRNPLWVSIEPIS